MDCKDYVTAARVASRIIEDTDLGGFVAASVGAEIVREYLLRSKGGACARMHLQPPGGDDVRPGPLL